MHLTLPHGIRSASFLASSAFLRASGGTALLLSDLLGTQRQAIAIRSQELPVASTSRPEDSARLGPSVDVIRTSLLGVGAPLGGRLPAVAISMTTLRPAPAMQGGKKRSQQQQQQQQQQPHQQPAQEKGHTSQEHQQQHYKMEHGVSPTSSELSECPGSGGALAATAAAAADRAAASSRASCSYETDLRDVPHQLHLLRRRAGVAAPEAAATEGAVTATVGGSKRKLLQPHQQQQPHAHARAGHLFADADDERRFFGLPPAAGAAAGLDVGCNGQGGHAAAEGCGCGEESGAAGAATSNGGGAAVWGGLVATPAAAAAAGQATAGVTAAAAAAAVAAAKSAKRRAAEALLAQRFGGGGGGAAADATVAAAAGTQAATAIRCAHSSSLLLGSSGAGGGSEDTSSGSDTDGPAAPAVSAARAAALRRLATERLGSGRAASATATATGTATTSVSTEGEAGQAAKRARVDLSALAASALGRGASASGAAAGGSSRGAGAAGSTAGGGGGSGGNGASPRLVLTTVPPCDPARGCRARMPLYSGASALGEGVAAAAAAGQGSASPTAPVAAGPAWCGFEVKVPSLHWQAVFDEPPGSLARYPLARGYEKLVLPEGLAAYCVESAKHVEDALLRLRASMTDRVIAIDLEWRPETVAGRSSPVALVQLASSTTCVLLRVSAMGYSLPAPVTAFLSDPSLVILGFGWDGADEAKMKSTFGMGKARFRRFIDLQEVARTLGYHGYGLARLTRQVLGVPLHKSKSVSRSNWAAPQLTAHQLKYASLDVLAAGQLFRALRLWHSSPSPCAGCRNAIGEPVQLRAATGSGSSDSPACHGAAAGPLAAHECEDSESAWPAGPAGSSSAAAAAAAATGAGPGACGGVASAGSLLKCNAPGCRARGVPSLQAHLSHCASTGHPPRYGACDSCGRTYELAAAAAAAAAAAGGAHGWGKAAAPVTAGKRGRQELGEEDDDE